MDGYKVGETARLSVAFTAFDLPVDAGTLTLTMQAGSAADPVDLTGSIVHDGPAGSGLYHADYDIVSGTEPRDPHRYTWRSTGTLRAVAGGQFSAQIITP